MFFTKNKSYIERKNLRILSGYIKSNLKKGFGEDEIKQALLSANWPEVMINEEISKWKNKKMEGRIMPKRISEEQARSFLRQVDAEKGFWVNNGAVLSNLEELSKQLKSIAPEQFSHHVNSEKNDFSIWVHEVIGDSALAKSISRAKTPQTLKRTLDKRVSYLKKLI
jgi:hypothetical protein